jgi:hydrogenase maturation factor
MCFGEITSLTEIWGEGALATARAADGSIVSLALVPEAAVGSYVLCQSGLAIEILEPDRALEAISLRRALHSRSHSLPAVGR